MWQRELGTRLGLRGRILVSAHGVNATVGGDTDALLAYRKTTRSYPGFDTIDFKWSFGHRDDFPKLSVKVRPELVAFQLGDELKVTHEGVVGGGERLTPPQLHELVDQHTKNGSDVTFFDARNAIEAKVGRFRGAIVPDTRTTHDFIRELESGKYDHLKDKPIVTYCTGGIRCEILTVAMKNRGFSSVYQLDGGIVRYAEAYGNSGLWEGSLYVFDKRMVIDFEHNIDPISSCEYCGAPTKTIVNCSDLECRVLTLTCSDCQDASHGCLHRS